MERQFQAELRGQQWRPDQPPDGGINNGINNNSNGNIYHLDMSKPYDCTLFTPANGNAATPFSTSTIFPAAADSPSMMTNDSYGGSLGGGSSGGHVNVMLVQQPWMVSNTGMESSSASEGALNEPYPTLRHPVVTSFNFSATYVTYP